jgi:ABC-2 type transport system permease protein
MKALYVARKTLIELWREPLLLGLVLFFPVALVSFYYVAFGQTEGGLSTYLSMLVLNEDEGYLGGELVAVLQSTEWEGDPVFDVSLVSERRSAEIDLRERKAALLLVIPPDYTAALLSGDRVAELALVGDPNSETFIFARSFLNSILRAFAPEASGLQEQAAPITYEFLPGTGTMSDFEFGVGGIIIFGVMFLMITTATVMVRETVQGTLRRLKLSPISAGALLLGVTLAQMAAAALQVPITLGSAILMGFQNNGSLLLTMAISLLTALSAVGVGLVVACFARNDGEATNLASLALVPLVFLSGALFPLPQVPLFTLDGRTVDLYHLLPTTHAAEAMRQVLVFGADIREITYELGMMTVLSALLLLIGVRLYQRMRLRGA